MQPSLRERYANKRIEQDRRQHLQSIDKLLTVTTTTRACAVYATMALGFGTWEWGQVTDRDRREVKESALQGLDDLEEKLAEKRQAYLEEWDRLTDR